MSLKSTAQILVVQEPELVSEIDATPMIVSDAPVSSELEVSEQPVQIEIQDIDFMGDLPGADHSPEAPLEIMEVQDNSLEVSDDDVSKADVKDLKKNKKSDKWDWESKGAHGFIAWIKERFESVPRHSGYDSAGLERAVSYLDKLDSEISKAMRLDLEGELDADKIEEIRSKIDDGIDRLNERLDRIKKSKKNRKKKSEQEVSDMIKTAQKVTGVQGIYIVAPLLISRIARVCINGMVSAGHDIEDLFNKQVTKYKLTDREQAEVMQLLADMGYPLRQDRGYLLDEDVEISSSNNFDWSAQYKA